MFFCGAGVSMAHAMLPSFAKLANKVITDLGATEDSKAKRILSKFLELNKDPNTRGVISADHIFSALIRSFDRVDINCSVAKCLLPKVECDLTAHKIILKLVQTQGGQTRLITTNFDLLFEASNKKLNSVTRSNLPNIEYADNDWGIVHLHGKVKKDYSGPDRDGFVLSTSEFGDAYLAQGWARNFVKDVLRKFVAVFIGYSADDPPMRYLLEGLQQNDRETHNVFAFQSADDESIAQWDEKGVTPIVYDLDNMNTHAPLWESLSAWSMRARNPTAWKNRLLSRARKGPANLLPHERGMVAHLVKSKSGSKAFMKLNPPLPSEWLCVLDSGIRLKQVQVKDRFPTKDHVINPRQVYGIDNDPPPSDRNVEYSHEVKAWDAFLFNEQDYENLNEGHLSTIRNFKSSEPGRLPPRLEYLAQWIAKVADQRIAVWWAGRQSSLHPYLIGLVKSELTRNHKKNFRKPIIEAWNAIFELSYFYGRVEYQEYALKNHIKSSGWCGYFVREFSKISAPFLKRGNTYSISIPRDNRKKLSKYSLVTVDIDYPKGVYSIDVPDEYLPQVINALRMNLESAVDLKNDFSFGFQEICSIEPDDVTDDSDISRGNGLSGYVLYFVSLFRKLVDSDIEKARREFRRWRRDDRVFTRLRVWACGLSDLIDEEEFTNEILSLSNEEFWPFKGERDLLLSLRNKWNTLSKHNRKLIERKILKRPLKPRHRAREEHVIHTAHKQLSRLHWLKIQDCNLDLNLDKVTEKLRVKAPEWQPEYAKRAAESHDGRFGYMRTDTDWSDLKDAPLTEIIKKAQSKKRRNFRKFTEYAPFAGLCDDRPVRAISALSTEMKAGKFHSKFWEKYLSRSSRKNDTNRLKLLTAGRICQIPNKDFKDILLTASIWFEDNGPELREKNLKMFETLWEKFITTIKKYRSSSVSALVRQEDREIDWTGEAINSASGNLAELHMTDPVKDNLKIGGGCPISWLKKVNQLLNLPNDANRYAMVIFSFNLRWFHLIDPKWTEKNLINIIENDNAQREDKDAIWSGFMWGARFPHEQLFLKLKPHLLKIVSTRSTNRRHDEVLSGLLLSGWGLKDNNNKQYISNEELRNVLSATDEDFRNQILCHLGRWAKDETSTWDNKVLGFLQNVWPKDKKVRTSKTSARLFQIALEQKKYFPAVSKQVAQMISKVGNEHVFFPESINSDGETDEESNAEKYPEDYLNLLYAFLHDQPERWSYGVTDVLKIIEEARPTLLNDPRLIEIKARLNDL